MRRAARALRVNTSLRLTSPSLAAPENLGGQSLASPKRRRVTRACDECRRKKIKCDGKQPCTHCTVYSYGKLLPSVDFMADLMLRLSWTSSS